ncbi:[FeFe] hydrogenase H-cluster radical SAM maturase HydE [Lachnospiraceae bacterium 62-35]
MIQAMEKIRKLELQGRLSEEEWRDLFIFWQNDRNQEFFQEISARARHVREEIFGKKVYIRGLIEFTSYCRNDCYYCGLRKSNQEAQRYRLDEETILDCCKKGYGLGFRTFVLQGGEDGHFTEKEISHIIKRIKKEFPDCALTLSLGEWSYERYEKWFQAGADRYLLRHETADNTHYQILHPADLSLKNRMECLRNLKKIGYQTGCGIMVGSPGQTAGSLAKDMIFMEELQPEMVGIGPFIPQHATPFAEKRAGTLEDTLFLLALLRLMLPKVLLPSTTALGTIHPEGRELGILSGANVVMPNLSPLDVRKKYLLYDNKICTGDEAAEALDSLKKRMKAIGYEVVVDRGDSPYKIP